MNPKINFTDSTTALQRMSTHSPPTALSRFFRDNLSRIFMNPNRYWAKNIFPRSQTCLGLFCANLLTAVKRHFTRFSTPRLRPPVRGFTSGPLVRNRSAPSTVQWPFFGPCLKGAETIPARIPEANPSRPAGGHAGKKTNGDSLRVLLELAVQKKRRRRTPWPTIY